MTSKIVMNNIETVRVFLGMFMPSTNMLLDDKNIVQVDFSYTI
jgi:hypothetical protein